MRLPPWLAAITLLLSYSCQTPKNPDAAVKITGDGQQHYVEPVPLNRFPVSVMEASVAPGVPAVEVVQEHNGKKYGLRPLISEEQVRSVLLPGDLAVFYNPLTRTSTPMNIAQWGMFHAATVVRNKPYEGAQMKINPELPDDTLCFVHAGQGYDCQIWAHTHFFRINHADPAARQWVAEMSGKSIGTIQYDASFTTEILNNNGTMDQRTFQSVLQEKMPDSYCSELPFTLHSVKKKQIMFTGQFVSGFVSEFKDIRKQGEGRFTCPMDTDAAVDSLMQYIGGFDLNLSSTTKALLRKTIRQYVKEPGRYSFGNWIRNSALSGVDRLTGRKVMPSDFVKAFHNGNPHISYLGSWEANAKPTEDLCGENPAEASPDEEAPESKWGIFGTSRS